MATNGSASVISAPRFDDSAFSSWSSVTAVPSSFTAINDGNSAQVVFEAAGKDLAGNLEALNKALALQRRIEAGAESMLHVEQMKEPLRQQVQSERDTARARIEMLERQIQQTIATENRKKSDGDDRDDFRTALNHASTCVKTLNSITRAASSPIASTIPSSSTSTIPFTPQDPQQDRTRIETMNQLTTVLQRNLRVRYELIHAEVIKSIAPSLSDRASKECRAAAYRLIRHTLVDMGSVERLKEHCLDWHIVKSLARDSKHAAEKEQVIKLIRAMVEIGSQRTSHSSTSSGKVPLSEGVMRAFIAVVESQEDPFKSVCMQTLVEILLIDTELMVRTGGLQVLLRAMAEGPLEMAPLLVPAILHIADSPRTRIYLHPGIDLETVLSGVTDAYGKGVDFAERMRVCTRIISLMFRSWSGLIYFCIDELAAIRSIIDTLRIPSLETREIILDMFFDLLNIKPPEWYQTFIDGRRLTMYRKSGQALEQRRKQETMPQKQDDSLKLIDQHLALLLMILTRAGLLDALTSMLEESTTGSTLSRKATLLMAEVMQMASRLLPLDMAANIQAVPRVFNLAADYNHGEHRIVGTAALSAIDSFNRNRTRLQPAAMATSRPRANSVEDAVRRGQRQMEQVKVKLGIQMDDKTFQNTLLEAGVITHKDHTKWNFDVLSDIIEGPLLNSKRMEEAIKVSKFMRRLMSFFHPFAHRYSDMPGKGNLRWVKLGNSFLTTLLATPEGRRFLMFDDPFISEIVKGFAQLDPYNPVPPTDVIFSTQRMKDTLTYSYIDMLGTLSRTKDGLEILEKYNVFTAYYHLMELRSREDLMIRIIETLDYSIDGHPRVVLSKALTGHYKHVRLYATTHLGALIKRTGNATAWTLRLLLTQLYDPDMEVCEAAVHHLEEACGDPTVLQLIVQMRPTWEHLGPVGHPLLLKAMSTPIGFRYLHESGYINREMDAWYHDRNIAYVVSVEVFLAKMYNVSPAEAEETPTFDSIVPPHFYGEMAKTELGCAVLREKGHFGDFASFIRRHGLETEDSDLILKLRSPLWAVGSIGAADGGLPFLEEEEIIPIILEIAEQSMILSVRGTCFFVIGLISSTALGAEVLADYGWEATLSPLGLPTGICVPKDLEKFVSIATWDPVKLSNDVYLAPPTKDVELEVMTAVYNLSNTVIANTASRSLAKMKTKPEYREVFTSPTIFARILHTLSVQKYKLNVRRYILDLFDIQLDVDAVKAISDARRSLRTVSPKPAATLSNPAPPARLRAFSVIGRPGRSRNTESDDTDSEEEGATKAMVPERPVMSLRPMSRIVGFQ